MNNNLFKQSWILMKNNLIGIVEPLMFWLLVMMLVLAPLSTKSSVDIGFIIAASLGFLCFTAFLSGWYACVKSVVALKNKVYNDVSERNKDQIEILKNFFPGVADYMLSISILTVIYFIFLGITIVAFRLCSLKLLAIYNIPQEFFNVVNTGSQLKITEYIQSNLTPHQVLLLLGIFIAGFVVYMIFNLFVLWFAPAMFYESKNPVTAIILALKFLFKNIGISLLIILVMFAINFTISVVNVFTGNGLLSFIPLILLLTYFMYYVTTVFLYYDSKTQNTSNCGSKLDREV